MASPDPRSLSSYQYELPQSLVARFPCEPRDQCRLMVVDRSKGTIAHRRFLDLPDYLDSSDTVVANNTRVIRARLLGKRLVPSPKGKVPIPGGKVEFVLLEERAPGVWEGLFKASAKYVPGFRFLVPTPDGRGLVGELVRGSGESPHGTVEARFDRDPVESGAGEVPLPHYLARPSEAADAESYQTIYARYAGSAAAPTAGLHFTARVLSQLRDKGVAWRELTLHVGLGTFRPVKDPDITKHLMHEERYEIEPGVARALSDEKLAGRRRILAVGTTTVRTLESAWKPGLGFQEGGGRTSLFIRPGAFEFRAVDRLLTNFHLPGSTLLMLVCAFGGRELLLRAYDEAVREKYAFFSYGDAMLVI